MCQEAVHRGCRRRLRDVRASTCSSRHTIILSTGWATSTTAHSTTVDPGEVEAMQCLEEGTQKLEEGDVQAAKVRLLTDTRIHF